METNIKFNYPSSEKVYLSGKLYPEIKVGMRKVSLTPTITVEGGERRVEPNDPVYVYDTSGPYSDPNVEIDLEKGLPKLRQSWIDGRKESETQMYFAKQGVITQDDIDNAGGRESILSIPPTDQITLYAVTGAYLYVYTGTYYEESQRADVLEALTVMAQTTAEVK